MRYRLTFNYKSRIAFLSHDLHPETAEAFFDADDDDDAIVKTGKLLRTLLKELELGKGKMKRPHKGSPLRSQLEHVVQKIVETTTTISFPEMPENNTPPKTRRRSSWIPTREISLKGVRVPKKWNKE